MEEEQLTYNPALVEAILAAAKSRKGRVFESKEAFAQWLDEMEEGHD